MAVPRADMGTDDFERQEKRCAALDGLAVDRVVAVRRPDPVGMGKDAVIGAAAPRRTAFDLDRRMSGANPVDQRI